jgi:hypothetical protein
VVTVAVVRGDGWVAGGCQVAAERVCHLSRVRECSLAAMAG